MKANGNFIKHTQQTRLKSEEKSVQLAEVHLYRIYFLQIHILIDFQIFPAYEFIWFSRVCMKYKIQFTVPPKSVLP